MIDEKPPIEYTCPVCGKWGRNYGPNLTGPDSMMVTFYHCNPKARRGGKGCGEIFRRIKKGACEIYFHEWVNKNVIDEASQNQNERLIAMGFKLLELLKIRGLHDPFKRTFPSSQIHTLLNDKDSPLCECGCGKSKRLNGSGTPTGRFANQTCAEIVYTAAYYLGNPGPQVTEFLINVRGEKCEHCENTEGKYFELDHIVEVNEGGGMCWIDNFQILCPSCHKKKTAEYAARRAKRNKSLNQQEIEKQQPTLF